MYCIELPGSQHRRKYLLQVYLFKSITRAGFVPYNTENPDVFSLRFKISRI